MIESGLSETHLQDLYAQKRAWVNGTELKYQHKNHCCNTMLSLHYTECQFDQNAYIISIYRE